MWVRSQDKKHLAQCISFSVDMVIGGKKKGAISGTVGQGFRSPKTVPLALYDTKEEAILELQNIQEALASDVKIYEVN